MRVRRLATAACVAALVCCACGSEGGAGRVTRTAAPTRGPRSPSPQGLVPSPTSTASATRPVVRPVAEQRWVPFMRTGDVTVRLPSSRVELVGFHQSNHEGAREITVLPGAPRPQTLESRGRLTAGRTAADIVSDPDTELRAPVTGTVKRAGTYVLYCRYSDDYLVIAPDAQPSWEVKLLHIDGVRVRSGDRVVAGETVVAPRPTRLPFTSDTDELSAKPAWPHVHIEVVDPSIRNVPSPGSGC